ncbi:hypothetical protein SODALDRAFT_378789, partial [Sodiomyces alkalinus F11]
GSHAAEQPSSWGPALLPGSGGTEGEPRVYYHQGGQPVTDKHRRCQHAGIGAGEWRYLISLDA